MEKTDQVLSESIALFNDFATKGIDFVVSQSPELCEQIITRELLTNSFALTAFCLCGLVCWYLLDRGYRINKKIYLVSDENKEWRKKEDARTNAELLNIIRYFSFLFIMPIAYHAYCLIVVYSAPKVYLMEYFTSLIRN